MTDPRFIRLFGKIADGAGSPVELIVQPDEDADEAGIWLKCVLSWQLHTVSAETYFDYESLRALTRAYRTSLVSGPADYEFGDVDHMFALKLRYDPVERLYLCSIDFNYDLHNEKAIVAVNARGVRVEVDTVQRFLSQLPEMIEL